ncbi:MAG: hypothetical protein JWP89_6888 [Schlesneria sp.]|nr:hypothetical protein [Schlesneria sp.]
MREDYRVSAVTSPVPQSGSRYSPLRGLKMRFRIPENQQHVRAKQCCRGNFIILYESGLKNRIVGRTDRFTRFMHPCNGEAG